MSIYKTLFKETIIYSIGSFGSKIISFLLLPLYTFFLIKKDIGEYDLLISTATLLLPIVTLQISDSAYRFLISANEDEIQKSKIISNTLFIFVFSFSIFLFLFLIYFYFYNFKYSFLFVLHLFFLSVLPLLQSFLRGLKKTKFFAFNGIITTFLIVIFNALFIIVFKMKVEGILIANISANFFASIIISSHLKVLNFIKISHFDIDLIKHFLKYSLPLIPNLLSWWLIISASKFIILYFLGIEYNGLYSISSRFPSLLIIINSVLILPIQDLYLNKDVSINEFNKLINNYIKIELSLILILSLGAPIYTKFIVSNEFYDSWKYMPLLYLGVGFSTFGTLISLMYQKNEKTLNILKSTFIGALVTIIVSVVLISNFKLYAISFSFFVGFLIMFLIRYYNLKKTYQLNLNINLIIIFIMIFIGLISIQYLVNFAWQFSIFTISVVTISILNINNFKRIMKNHFN